MEEKHHDGDSFYIQHGGKEFVIRLYFVDAPEIENDFPERVREQRKHFGVTQDRNREVGEKAKAEVVALLKKKPFEVTTRWQDAMGRSQRYYGLVQIDGEDLGEILIRRGLARAKGEDAILPTGERPKDIIKKLRKLEAEAKTERVGVWQDSKKSPPRQSWWQRVWSFVKNLV